MSGKTVPLEGFGGGAALNFKVVGGTVQPAAARENTIWVNTDTPVKGYYFSTTQPEITTPGAVWILTGAFSPVAFNAIKRGGILVYPISAKQYIGGEWVAKDVQSWVDGAWVPWWTGGLYEYGNEYIGVTGGWNIVGHGSKSTGSMRVGSSEDHATETPDALITANAIDFAGYARIEAHIFNSATSSSIGVVRLYLLNESQGVVAQAEVDASNLKDYTLRVNVPSDGGKYYVSVASRHGATVRYTYADIDYVRASK